MGPPSEAQHAQHAKSFGFRGGADHHTFALAGVAGTDDALGMYYIVAGPIGEYEHHPTRFLQFVGEFAEGARLQRVDRRTFPNMPVERFLEWILGIEPFVHGHNEGRLLIVANIQKLRAEAESLSLRRFVAAAGQLVGAEGLPRLGKLDDLFNVIAETRGCYRFISMRCELGGFIEVSYAA